MNQQAFIFVGLPGAGKSTAAEMAEQYLRENGQDAVHTEVSDFVRTKFEAETGDSVNDNELGRWAAGKKEEYGNGYFVREMATVHGSHDRHLLLSGVRSPAEADAVRDVFGAENTTVIAIWTLPDLRFKRKYGGRVTEHHEKYEEFIERKERELWDWGAIEFFAEGSETADFIVPNNHGEDMLRNRVTTIVHALTHHRGDAEHAPFSTPPFPEGLSNEQVAQYL